MPSNTTAITVPVSTSKTVNDHLRSKAPKAVKDAANAARQPRPTAFVMDLSPATARKAADWMLAEAKRQRENENGDSDLARRLRVIAGRIDGQIVKAEQRAKDRAEKDAAKAAEQTDDQPATPEQVGAISNPADVPLNENGEPVVQDEDVEL